MKARVLNIEILKILARTISNFFNSETPLKSKEAEELLENTLKKQELLTKLEELKKGEVDSVVIEVNGKKIELTINDSYHVPSAL